MSQTFSWSRTSLLIKKYLYENRRSLQMHIGVYFGIVLLIDLLIRKNTGYPPGALYAVVFTNFWQLAFAMVISGSRVFEYFSTKQKRIAQLMVPASRTEKFASQMLIYVGLGSVALIAATFLAGFIAALIIPLYEPNFIFTSNQPISDEELKLMIAVFIGALLFLFNGQAWYILGSSLWPRKAFFKTFVALMALQILLPLIFPLHLFDYFTSSMHTLYRTNDSDITTYMFAADAGLFLFNIGLYALAWWRISTTRLMQKFY